MMVGRSVKLSNVRTARTFGGIVGDGIASHHETRWRHEYTGKIMGSCGPVGNAWVPRPQVSSCGAYALLKATISCTMERTLMLQIVLEPEQYEEVDNAQLEVCILFYILHRL